MGGVDRSARLPAFSTRLLIVERFPCPCCGYLTLSHPANGSFDLCPVCCWEDDPVQLDDPSYRGGANTPSLDEARRNFLAVGAMERRFLQYVRPPRPEEKPN